MNTWEIIQKDIRRIDKNALAYLTKIEKLPHQHGLQVAAYLWEGSCTTTNDIWYTLCRGLLWKIPLHWLKTYCEQILQIMDVDWQDDFIYHQACATFAHQTDILKTLLAWGKAHGLVQEAAEWESIDFQTQYYTQTMEHFSHLCTYYSICLSDGAQK